MVSILTAHAQIWALRPRAQKMSDGNRLNVVKLKHHAVAITDSYVFVVAHSRRVAVLHIYYKI